MLMPASRSFVSGRGGDFEWLDETASTNSAMVRSASAGAPDFSVIATASQTAGRGRLGRVWVAPPGQTLAVSLLLRLTGAAHPIIPPSRWGWFPLIAGLAMARAISDLGAEVRATVKWPNDVLIGGRKVCGILAELGADTLVLGAGVNLSIPADGLPTPLATSLVLEGVPSTDEGLPDAVLSGWLEEAAPLVDAFRGHGGDPERSGIRAAVLERCTTIGSSVEVQLPAGSFGGIATGIDVDGRLLVVRSNGVEEAVAAGDVTHLR